MNTMQTYALNVVPIAIVVYGIVVLFMRPPVKVIWATLAGGLVMALLNMVGDLIAIHASLWYYNATGLIDQLPLPIYTIQIFILGGLVYLLIWRFWSGRYHWLSQLLLFGLPVLGVLKDFWQSQLNPADSLLIWKSSFAWIADLVLWIIMFFAGYLVFALTAPSRQETTVSANSTAAIDK